MIIQKLFLILSGTLILMMFNGCLVNGNEQTKAECSNHGKTCKLHNQQPCCDENLTCKRLNLTNTFVCLEKVKLGDSCKTNQDCSDILHAKCSMKKKCVCRPNNIRLNSIDCAPLLNEFCWKNETCAPANSLCIDNVCKCDSGYLPLSNDRCLPKILGSFCENDTICKKIKFAECSPENMCVCRSNTIASSPISCSQLLGNRCQSNYDCSIDNFVCINNKCQCEFQFVPYSNTECKSPYIGMACENGIHCQNYLNYTTCSTDNKCICDNNYYLTEFNTCVPGINAHCSGNRQCALNNTICIDNQCQCKRNFVLRESRCIPARLNESCSMDTECDEIEFSTCSEDKICRCKDEYFAVNKTKCVLTIGGFCLYSGECTVKNSECFQNQCQCKLGYIAISKEQCLPTDLNGYCFSNDDCKLIINAECSEHNKCMCRKNYLRTDTTECAPLLNETCKNDKQCIPDNSVCIDNKCQCKFRYLQRSNDECVLNYLEKWCRLDEDCNEILNAKCSNANKCICHSNYVQLNATTCAPLLGGFCTNDAECKTDFSACHYNKCTCLDGYSSRSDNLCLPVFLRQFCRDDRDCDKISNAKCSDDNECICKSGYSTFDKGVCLPLIGSYCKEHKECLVYNSNCHNNKCQCLDNYVAQSNEQCVSSHFNKACYTNIDCGEIMNSYCSKYNFCACKSNYIAASGNRCQPILGKQCHDDTLCIINNSLCINNKCQCKPKYVSDGNNKCIPKLDESCEQNEDCIKIPNARCSIKKKCICKNDYIASEKVLCLPLLGGKCSGDENCSVENSICNENKCQCKPHHSTHSNHRCESITLGKSCSTNLDCEFIQNSKCSVNKICICDANTFALSQDLCVPILNGFCFSDNQCKFNGFHCIDNKCQCKPDFSSISSSQCMATHLLHSCEDSTDCSEPWHAECSDDHKCICRSNNIAMSRSMCLPLLDGYCWRDDQCQTGNSICENFRCACGSDFVPVSNNLCVPVNFEV
ncbi:fibrillin-1-like isoform X2 [Microplitis demolitor]|uniref:fibrillin-1-like isoform X2 n=1 Tax=Microplitis demolitor TaxID=69319 RepID=UPI00235B661C|nr:fibrillin-1-like isoform X2 [Microplitis demolitor]